MVEAEKAALDFYKERRNPEKVKVNSCEPLGEGWRVVGYGSWSAQKSYSSENFTIEIDRTGHIRSYKFEPGFSIAVG